LAIMTVPALGAAPEREIARVEGVRDSEFVVPLLTCGLRTESSSFRTSPLVLQGGLGHA
jgi:hypothetical protein